MPSKNIMFDQFHVEVHAHNDLSIDEERRLRRMLKEFPQKALMLFEAGIVPRELKNKVNIKISQ